MDAFGGVAGRLLEDKATVEEKDKACQLVAVEYDFVSSRLINADTYGWTGAGTPSFTVLSPRACHSGGS